MKTKFEKLNELYNTYQKDDQSISKMVEYLLDYNKFNLRNDGLDILKTNIFIDEIRENNAGEIIKMIETLLDIFTKEEIKNAVAVALLNLRPEKSCYNLFYLFNQQFKHNEGNPVLDKKEFQSICETRLLNYTKKTTMPNMQIAFEHLYSCWDFVDKNNEVHLTTNSCKIMLEFVKKHPEDYLIYTIRPRLSLFSASKNYREFDFTFEPFTSSIFNGWPNFELFLKEQADRLNNKTLIKTLLLLYNNFKDNHYKYFTINRSEYQNFIHIPEIKRVFEIPTPPNS
jgi:hypothetical protein